jgi:hypothetical protein
MTSPVDFTGVLSSDEKIKYVFKNYSSLDMNKIIDTLVDGGFLDDMLQISEHPTITNTLYGCTLTSDSNFNYKPSCQFKYELSDIIHANINSLLKRHQQPIEESDIIAEIKKIKVLSDIDSDIIDPCIIKLFETMVAEEYIKKIDTKYYKVIY